jgi:LytS/YehU family sensor histidine kinase
VPVLVWKLQPKDENALDVYEGYPRLYRKELVRVRVRVNGKQVRVMVYIMNDGHLISPPRMSYYNTIREGYMSASFDLEILRDAAKKSQTGRRKAQ